MMTCERRCKCSILNCRFFDASGWKQSALKEWMNETGKLTELLLLTMHLTYGQPVRASELCSLLYRNHKNASRNLCADEQVGSAFPAAATGRTFHYLFGICSPNGN